MLSRLLNRNEGQGPTSHSLLACLNTTPGSINPTVSKVHFLAVVNVTSHYEAAPTDHPVSWVRKGVGHGTRAHGRPGSVLFSESIET